MKVTGQDPATGHIEASTGMSLVSWGEKIHIDLQETDPGKTTALVSSDNKAQLVAGAKNKRNLDGILSATWTVLNQWSQSGSAGT